MYLEDWAQERAAGASIQAFAECWGVHRSTHWRWARSPWKKASRRPRLAEARVKAVVELDKRYRSSWDVRAIAHIARIGKTSVAKILRAERGPRPQMPAKARVLRTRFLARDVMWSSDFVELPDGRKLLKTIDEMSRYRLGWDAAGTETAGAVVSHARRILERMRRPPLVWKFDHGAGFMSKAFQALLAEHGIASFPIPPRAPWANGRTERDHQEIKNWLIPVARHQGEELDREIDEGMLALNFIKPRAVLNYRTSAKTYFDDEGPDHDQREEFQRRIREAMRGSNDERLRRRTIRTILSELGLYEEWLQEGKSTGSVNRT